MIAEIRESKIEIAFFGEERLKHMNKKITHYLAAGFLVLTAIWTFNHQAHTVQAKIPSTIRTVMYTSQAYDEDGQKVDAKYPAFRRIEVDKKPLILTFKPYAPYYKISGKKQYIKANNIDGVKRAVKHNSYVYATSSRRANYRLIRKGASITTYGGTVKFKNGLRYYRIGGPAKQYVRASNLGKITASNTEETIATVTRDGGAPIYEINNGLKTTKKAKKGTTFVVDRAEEQGYAEEISQLAIPNAVIYRIKGTNNWLYCLDVKVKKDLPSHYYDYEHYSYIRFYQDTDVYNADGTKQDHKGQRIRKQGGNLKVDKLLYIWVPAENKAELFYHLKGHEFYASDLPGGGGPDSIDVGDGYVKASDVRFIAGVKLSPINTAEEAQQNAKPKTAK